MSAKLIKVQPVCKAPGLPICELEDSSSNVEVVDNLSIGQPEPGRTLLCDCVKKASEEEEPSLEQSTTVDEELQLEDIQDELEKNRALVDLIGQRLSLNIPDCPELDACMDMQVELNKDGMHPEILKLHRNNSQLRQQLSQLQHSCKAVDLSLKYMHNSLCRDLEAGAAMQRRLNELDSFKRIAEHEHALCRQRYRHLEQDKFDWNDCFAYISKHYMELQPLLKKYVRRTEYGQLRQDASELLNQAKLEAKELHDYLAENMNTLSQRVDHSPGCGRLGSEFATDRRMAMEIAAFLQRNEHLFNRATH
ncbi:uncharacterized protein [Drosophila virilis]|uniref:Uncharacterized protein n=1 Tax=Drosophila virilis TaxID=7244 RepID=B4M583_DROVI|nr:uncharacterized protein LOC6633195 [Drosophila virilis]EDW59794.1 uncharacterized protein Dvir_GJ11073 [Drosophila virilis]